MSEKVSVLSRCNIAIKKLIALGIFPEDIKPFPSSTKDDSAATKFLKMLEENMVEMDDLPQNVYKFVKEIMPEEVVSNVEPSETKEEYQRVGANENGVTEVVIRQRAEVPAPTFFEGDAGSGFEDTDSEDYAVPILRILQTNSHEVDKDDDKYVKGAEAGMIFNIATQECYDEITVIPCAYTKKDVEWVPRGEGNMGTFVGEHETNKVWQTPPVRNEKGKLIIPATGNELVRTAYFFVLLVNKTGGTENAVIAMASTQLTPAKKWMTMMSKIMFQGKNGQYQAPMYSHYYTLSTERQSNAKGVWKAWKIEKGEILQDPAIYAEAKAFRDLVKSGLVKADQAAQSETGSVDPNSPPNTPEDEDF